MLNARGICLLLLFVVAGWNRADSTPIIVGRIPNGFLIGTNLKNSAGTPVCKVRYAGRKALIVAGYPMMMGSRSGQIFFDLDKEMWSIGLARLTPEEVFNSANAIINKRVQQYEREIKIDPDYVVVLVSLDSPLPQLWVERVTFSKLNHRFTSTFEHPDMPPGKLMEVINDRGPLYPPISSVSEQVVLQELEKATQRHRRSPDVSYAPPYVVLELNPSGVHFLTDDEGACTGKHPIK